MRPNPLLPEGIVDFLDDLLLDQRGDTCVISRPTTDRSVGGARTRGWEVVGTESCRVRSTGGSEGVQGGSLGVTAQTVIDLPRDTVAKNGYKIDVNGKTFDVVFVPEADSYGLVMTVQAVISQG